MESNKLWPVLAAGAALALYPLVAGGFGIDLVTKIMVYAIFALSLELLVGTTGLVCFGQAAFFGLAGYAAVLLSPRFDGRGIVSRPALRQLWGEHRDGRRNHSHRLWSLLMLEFWFREFIDGDAADLPLEYAMVKAA